MFISDESLIKLFYLSAGMVIGQLVCPIIRTIVFGVLNQLRARPVCCNRIMEARSCEHGYPMIKGYECVVCRRKAYKYRFINRYDKEV